jgi:hypothetical protein
MMLLQQSVFDDDGIPAALSGATEELAALEEKLSILEACSWMAIEWHDAKYQKHPVLELSIAELQACEPRRLVIGLEFS